MGVDPPAASGPGHVVGAGAGASPNLVANALHQAVDADTVAAEVAGDAVAGAPPGNEAADVEPAPVPVAAVADGAPDSAI